MIEEVMAVYSRSNSRTPPPARQLPGLRRTAFHVDRIADEATYGLYSPRNLGRQAMDLQVCTGCGRELPITREFFGNTPSRGFRRKCRSCVASATRAHHADNPEMVAARVARRRSLEAAAGPRYSNADIAKLRVAQQDCCAYCMTPLLGMGHVDHMTPLARGGSNARSNLALACFQCNTEKHAKTAEEYFWWRSERGMFVSADAYVYRRLFGKG